MRIFIFIIGLLIVSKIEAQNPFRLMTQEQDQVYRKLFPKIIDNKLKKMFNDPELLLYTDLEMPRAHQDWEGDLKGIHSPYNNVSANKTEPFGNGNRELPWNTTAGTDNTNTKTFKFLWLPTDENGKKKPIVWYRSNPNKIFENREADQPWAWLFPVGAIVGEVLYLSDSQNNNYVYELRTRIRHLDKWTVGVYKPFPTAKDLSTAIKKLRNNWNSDSTLVNCCVSLDAPLNQQLYVFKDNHPSHSVISEVRSIDELPPLNEQLVKELLNQPFKLANGISWKGNGNNTPSAPTTKESFHIVPANYAGGFIPANSQSCMNCHQTTNEIVSKFHFGRDWYGRIRGSDGIFSFHPFDESCISHSGYNQGVIMNSKLINAGIIAEYDSTKHLSSSYYRIESLQR